MDLTARAFRFAPRHRSAQRTGLPGRSNPKFPESTGQTSANPVGYQLMGQRITSLYETTLIASPENCGRLVVHS